MRAKINKDILEKIKNLFSRAKKTKDPVLARKYVILARNLAKRNNIRIPKQYRKIFCHKCNALFRTDTMKKRIRNKKISIKCLKCNSYTRYVLKGGKKK